MISSLHLSSLDGWYYGTAIAAALLVILPAIGKGSNGIVRTARYLHRVFTAPAKLAKLEERLANLYEEVAAFRHDFSKHSEQDLAFQQEMALHFGQEARKRLDARLKANAPQPKNEATP